jgi:hypothetical protein
MANPQPYDEWPETRAGQSSEEQTSEGWTNAGAGASAGSRDPYSEIKRVVLPHSLCVHWISGPRSGGPNNSAGFPTLVTVKWKLMESEN